MKDELHMTNDYLTIINKFTSIWLSRGLKNMYSALFWRLQLKRQS